MPDGCGLRAEKSLGLLDRVHALGLFAVSVKAPGPVERCRSRGLVGRASRSRALGLLGGRGPPLRLPADVLGRSRPALRLPAHELGRGMRRGVGAPRRHPGGGPGLRRPARWPGPGVACGHRLRQVRDFARTGSGARRVGLQGKQGTGSSHDIDCGFHDRRSRRLVC